MNRLAPWLICSLAFNSSVLAQKPTSLTGTEQFSVTSPAGIEYLIDVSLPPKYSAAATERYPTFYLLDGNLWFGTAVAVQRMMALDGQYPGMIIVGIGYPEPDPAIYTPAYSASRSRDYTPTVTADDPGGGRGPAFLAFLRDQLIPMIDGRYRTDPKDRALGGHSYGGLFTTYALFHDPALFRRYWLGSPSLWYDSQLAFRWLDTGTAPASGTRVFLSVGATESNVMVDPMNRMAAGLKARFPGLEVRSVVFPDEGHLSVVPGSLARALRALYARPVVPIAAADARDLVGRWVSTAGGSFSIARNNGRLIIRDSLPGFAISSPLRAYSRDELYTESSIPYLATRDSSGRIVSITRRRGLPDSIYRKP